MANLLPKYVLPPKVDKISPIITQPRRIYTESSQLPYTIYYIMIFAIPVDFMPNIRVIFIKLLGNMFGVYWNNVNSM